MQKTLLTCFCLLLSIVMQAATIDVKGVVTDAQGLPLPGVTVVVKNENVGMTTDLDGRFSIQVGQGKTLVFSYIGYRTKEIQVADKTLLDIVLEEDNKILDEVVVVGYGVQKKSDVTGSIASVSAKILKVLPTRMWENPFKVKSQAYRFYNFRVLQAQSRTSVFAAIQATVLAIRFIS